MKKSVLIIALAFGVSGAFAQDLTSKKGEPMLPEAEDWAISMNADPIFEWVGNAFNGTSGQAPPTTLWQNTNQTIIGKKFIDEKSAYRVMLRIGLVNQTFKNMVTDITEITAPTFPNGPAMVEDKYKMSRTNIAIGVGKEMRRGKTRLQGFYGADAMIWVSMSSMKYTYGNVMTGTPASAAESATPISTSWNTTNGTVAGVGPLGTRDLKSKAGMTFGIGVRGFVGAEYFIFPKIAVGAEYGWGLGYQMMGKGKSTVETTGGTPTATGEVETVTSGGSKLGIDTDINSGNIFGFLGASSSGNASLRVTFHF